MGTVRPAGPSPRYAAGRSCLFAEGNIPDAGAINKLPICSENSVCGMVGKIRSPKVQCADRPRYFQAGIFRERRRRMNKQDPPYTQSKIEPKKLREAVQRVFAYERPPKAPKEPPPPKARHRVSAPKKA